MSDVYFIKELAQLESVAKVLKDYLKEYPIIIFDGEMGAGKTTFIRAFCKVLQVEDEVSSPTYSIINTYHTVDQEIVNHFDFYRIEGELEAIESGLDEVIDSGEICLIEWSERIPKLLPESYVRVSIELNEDLSRLYSISVV
ncbi:MAG: tRNA threonylcarbamoyladenosine biosynthesis protein TsaE [Flavobacteriales bacterium]|jgi:tRNA threonylcarbamoyladenosine biosynthesis protein TsaE